MLDFGRLLVVARAVRPVVHQKEDALSVLGVEYPTTPGSELGCLTLTTPEREIPVCVY